MDSGFLHRRMSRHLTATGIWSAWSLEPVVFTALLVAALFYARGLGIVLERDVAGGSEIFRLVSVTHV